MTKHIVVDYLQPDHIHQLINYSKKLVRDDAFVLSLIKKAKEGKGLTPDEAAVLLHIEDQKSINLMIQAAHELKERIYGRRIVLFAPLYISNYCVNHCIYCGYKASNQAFQRRKLSSAEVKEEVEVLLSLGHKRIALEAGEDARECSMDYIIQMIKDIYSVKVNNENIRRININVAATTVKNYQRLKDSEIGTYILFQETYHKPTYEKVHPRGPKSNFLWHSTAMDRALIGGIEDVGVGVLYGLYDYKYETIALLLHAKYLEQTHGVGPHTISVPRLKAAENVCLETFSHLVSDHDFKKIIAILRLAVPYAGLILSTREESSVRDELLALGISQISAGSCTGVGGYVNEYKHHHHNEKAQFEIGDHRSPVEVIKSLINGGYLPSFCTACYRAGRVGDRFMSLAKTGNIHDICQPNAILTFKEFLIDHGDEELLKIGKDFIQNMLEEIPDDKIKALTVQRLKQLEDGERDLRF